MLAILKVIILNLIIGTSAHAKTLIHSKGDNFLVHINSHSEVSISNTKIIQWKDLGSRLKIKALKAGETTISTSSQYTKIIILNEKNYSLYKAIKKWIAKKIGLYLSVQNGEITIKGHLHRISDWLELAEIHKKYEGEYSFQAQIDNDLVENLKNYFYKKTLDYKHLSPELKLTPIPTFYLLSNKQISPINNIFHNFGFSFQEHKKSNQQIHFQLYFVDISKSLQKQFGLNWDGQFRAQVLPQFLNESLFNASFSHGKESGKFKLIQSVRLICSDQTDCEMQEGGEIPIKTHSFSSSQVRWKSYGLNLKFKPTLTAFDKINIKLSYSISSPDFAEQADGAPSFKTKKISTEFTSNNDQFMYIGGLSIQSNGKNQSGRLPFNTFPLFNHLLNNNYKKESSSKTYLFIKTHLYKGSKND